MEKELTELYRDLAAALKDTHRLTNELLELDFDVDYDKLDGLFGNRGECVERVADLTERSNALIDKSPDGRQLRELCNGNSSAAYNVAPVLKTLISDLLTLIKENRAADSALQSKYMNQYNDAKSHLHKSVEDKRKLKFYSSGLKPDTGARSRLYFQS